MKERASGILIHITSLPSPYGIGDLGPGAYNFVDFLAKSRQNYWQILPLNPTSIGLGNSPYNSHSAFAGNPLLISPILLVEDGLLSKSDIEDHPPFPEDRVDYSAVTSYKERIFEKSYINFKNKGLMDNEFENFCIKNSHWIDDYSLFLALKKHFNHKIWNRWPFSLRDHDDKEINTWREKLDKYIEMEKFLQYLFFKQWFNLKRYCNSKGIRIIGDIPIYVNYDSADVWANSKIFKLDNNKKPLFVAGVPPDYFSSTGQLWGNPVYKWNALKKTGYLWWINRIKHNTKLFDIIRIDHFRGFISYWEVKAEEKSAINGRWIKTPWKDFFNKLKKHIPNLSIITEDLGTISGDVRKVIESLEFPGMKVLLFAFGPNLPHNPYAPHNHIKNSVVYTGTHDNNTIRGWFEKEAKDDEKEMLFRYLGHRVSADEINNKLIRLAMLSVANLVIIPMQDILGLGEEARMNRPATLKGNWEWRLLPEQLMPSLVKELSEITEIYGRAQEKGNIFPFFNSKSTKAIFKNIQKI